MPPSETKKALIVVRTYPVPAATGVEVSCTAAITENGEWLRLFPIPYRFLDQDQRFSKYQWIEASMAKATKDPRPESHKLNSATIKIVSPILPTTNEWRARKKFVFPLKAHCLCCLKKEQVAKGYPTLGIFQPRDIKRLVIKPAAPDWTESQKSVLRQKHLFQAGPKQELEKVPFDFQYEFNCDEVRCKGHKIISTDWEMGQSWRKWTREYGAGWEAEFRKTYEAKMIERDTHFFVGTMHGHPNVWIIVGLFYPPKAKNRELFDL
jgi:hypothetical protein